MAYAIIHFFPGGTKEQYEASLAAVHPSRDRLPTGQVFHAAGPSEGGWRIIASTTPRRAGSGSATARSCPDCSRASTVASPRLLRRSAFELHNMQR